MVESDAFNRLGLKPVLRRVWAKPGERPRAPVHHRCRWLHLHGFVQPTGGRVLWCLLMPTVSAATFAQVLAAFAADVGAGPGKEILLVLDGAGWHVAKELVMPDHLHPAFPPPYSPELQPAERLWPLANEAVANRCFEDLAAPSDALEPHCLTLAGQPELIRGHTLFGWWPQTKSREAISRI
jgi:DDE superfamily endonuclease